MEYLSVTEESLSKAAKVIRDGGMVAFPTETVYGLGADAFNPSALVKIFEAKARPRFDPLIIHIADVDTLDKVADFSKLSQEAKSKLNLLIQKFWPGPLSLVLPKNDKIPGIATAGLNSAAIRLPANETAQKLIRLAGGAIAAPSANPFGSLSPTRAEHVKEGLGDKVDIILDGGPCTVGVESTVLDISGEQACILRHGGVTKEEIEKILGSRVLGVGSGEEREEKLASPGMLKSHYAPRTPLIVFNHEPHEPHEKEDSTYLFFDSASRDEFVKNNTCLLPTNYYLLTTTGDVREAAACLFETLHKLDKLGAKRIYAQLAPEKGLGAAINDRLRRASR